MALYSAVGSALSGLNAAQAGIDLVSRNIANAGTPGYTRKTLLLDNQVAAGGSIGVSVLGATRNVDSFLQQQLRTETASTQKLNVYSDFLGRVDGMFGTPDSNTSVAASITSLETTLQSVATTPDDPAARQTFLNSASNLASQLNSMSAKIQGMRLEAEQNIATSVQQANTDLQTVAGLNDQISQRQASNYPVADLQDLRDNAINDLSKLMDVKTVQNDDGTVTVFTGGGQLLLDKTPVKLTFDEHTSMDANSSYNIDASQRKVGTITLQNGTTQVDLIASGAITSGSIAGYIQMRDTTLPQAQSQLDELASQLALSLSQETVPSTAASGGGATGLGIDTSSMLSGNQLNLSYTDDAGVSHKVTVVKVTDPSVLPLASTATADPNDTVIGINFNQPMSGVVSDLQAALGTNVVVSNPSGSTINFLNDAGSGGTSTIDALTATVTPASLTDAGTGLPLFVDGQSQKAYSGSLDNPPQVNGFAGRIQVNSAILADDTKLIVYSTSPATAIGDDMRPRDLLSRLTDTSRTYSAASGIGSTTTPFQGSVDAFARRIVSFQSSQSANATNAASAQQIVSNTLQDKFNGDTGVNIDDEMANLIVLQNSYAANARLITTVQQLFDTLLSIGK
ncbi:MAG TPA: flagellar hook-associated protein FlgK [Parvibaculum sp.]